MVDEGKQTPQIMCTLTPKQILEEEALVKEMHRAGMRSVRINTAHLTDVEQLGLLASRIKKLLLDVLILIDTKGPEMRTTAVAEDAEICLEAGSEIAIEGNGTDKKSTPACIYVNYPNLHEEVSPGDMLLIDDGHLRLRVAKVAGKTITAIVLEGGMIGSRKGIAVAGVDLNLPAVSPRDEAYIRYAAQARDIDLIAHSFVRSAEDVLAVKAAMVPGAKPIIAKIENQQGIDNLQSIISAADGLLIARGDLTASIGRDKIPAAQAKIAAAAKAAGLPLYLATNILPSLMRADEASAADIQGISLAKEQGVDVMLLTNETASGPRPLRSVEVLRACLTDGQ